jgi:hypothetical protein
MTTHPTADRTSTAVREATGAALTATQARRPALTRRTFEYDLVDDCSDASFPASDPPSWWSGA